MEWITNDYTSGIRCREHLYMCTGASALLAPFTLPFACGDPAQILRILLCVKVSDAAGGEISLEPCSASGGSIRIALLVNQTSVKR